MDQYDKGLYGDIQPGGGGPPPFPPGEQPDYSGFPGSVPPPQQYPGPPPPYMPAPAPNILVVHKAPSTMYSRSMLGTVPLSLQCPHCGSQVHSEVDSSLSLAGWVAAGVLCFFGFWCCACIPCCMDSCKDFSHDCPQCNCHIGDKRAF